MDILLILARTGRVLADRCPLPLADLNPELVPLNFDAVHHETLLQVVRLLRVPGLGELPLLALTDQWLPVDLPVPACDKVAAGRVAVVGFCSESLVVVVPLEAVLPVDVDLASPPGIVRVGIRRLLFFVLKVHRYVFVQQVLETTACVDGNRLHVVHGATPHTRVSSRGGCLSRQTRISFAGLSR